MPGLVIDEVAARGVMGTRGVVAKPFSLGSGQPRPQAGRRKHIADGPEGARAGTQSRQNLRYKGLRTAAQGLELDREGFQVGAGNGGPEKVREFLGVGDRLNFLAQTLRDLLESDFQSFKDGLLLREDQTFLATFLAELFGE